MAVARQGAAQLERVNATAVRTRYRRPGRGVENLHCRIRDEFNTVLVSVTAPRGVLQRRV